MLFNSLDFLFFFIAVFTVYWSIPNRLLWMRNLVILTASYVFYGFWDWRFLGLIALSTLVDYISALQIAATTIHTRKRLWLFLSIAVNLGMLGYFKYYDFFAESLALALSQLGFTLSYSTLHVVLPIGISFYTFQTLSYTIDVYRGHHSPTKNLLQFASFVAFFPQLVAGPIERAANLLPQFSVGKIFDYKMAVSGMFLILYGFFKKIAIADNLAPFVDDVFSSPQSFSNWEILLGFLSFGFQVYADFSGYSDIAIGTASVFGFTLNTNFKTPFFAKSIREFWTRWHISLYTWFRDYVYIPLGGSRVHKFRRPINILITFGLSGLWHGAGVNYVLFGLIHGTYYNLEKRYIHHVKIWFTHILALIGISLAWGVFRSPNLETTRLLFINLFNFQDISSIQLDRNSILIAFTFLLFAALEFKIRFSENFATWLNTIRLPFRITIAYILVFWTLVFGAFETGQHFIYFQF